MSRFLVFYFEFKRTNGTRTKISKMWKIMCKMDYCNIFVFVFVYFFLSHAHCATSPKENIAEPLKDFKRTIEGLCLHLLTRFANDWGILGRGHGPNFQRSCLSIKKKGLFVLYIPRWFPTASKRRHLERPPRPTRNAMAPRQNSKKNVRTRHGKCWKKIRC